ncbi:hypothetical protein [Trichloromonas sp.]|uniref:hypothetical protein n=1 Tax=Trichloromonas sp. TaxID=3069249 RepID=UPI003D816EF6
MALSGNPKKLAQDIAGGYFSITPPMMRQYTPADLKTIVVNLGIVARDIRQEQVPQDDALAIKQKNTRLSRLNQAEIVIRAHCKKLRIPI